MPVVGVNRDLLFEKLGRTYTEEEFDELCFEYGIELDDVTSERELLQREMGASAPAGGEASQEVIYKIDIPANRYDMLCVEGIARALNVFKERLPSPEYRLAQPNGSKLERLTVTPEVALVRPFVVAALLRGVRLDEARYKSLIDLQDKLHGNLCRNRSLVAIGTHDYDTLQGPFSYEALPPKDIVFRALKQEAEMPADQLLEHYEAHDLKLGKFVPLLKGSPVFPVIFDANRTVLSLPPIINGAHSAISLATRNIFIECTATDLAKARVVLNTVACMFAEYCATPFTIEPVEVTDVLGNTAVYPDLTCRQLEVPVGLINQRIAPTLALPAPHIARLLTKMQLASQPGPDNASVTVTVPPVRSDILHPCDVIEDVAVAYGFNNLQHELPPSCTEGRELPLSQLSDMIRAECMAAGYTEILTWALLSAQENFSVLRLGAGPPEGPAPEDQQPAVRIGNPKTTEFQVARTNLLSSALKTLGANQHAPLPLKLFEVSDVILLDPEAESGARNERRLVGVYSSKEAGFEVTHGLLNRLMEVLGVPHKEDDEQVQARFGGCYEWRESNCPTYFPGR